MLNSFPSAIHSMPNFAVLEGESRHESSVNNNKQPCSCQTSTLNHQILTYFVQQRSFLSSCYHLNRKQTFKVKNLVPMTMHHGCCDWSHALYQVLVRMLMQKRPLFRQYYIIIIESFKFLVKNNYEYEISLKVFSHTHI